MRGARYEIAFNIICYWALCAGIVKSLGVFCLGCPNDHDELENQGIGIKLYVCRRGFISWAMTASGKGLPQSGLVTVWR